MKRTVYSSSFLADDPLQILAVARERQVFAIFCPPVMSSSLDGQSPLRTKLAHYFLRKTGTKILEADSKDIQTADWDALTDVGTKRKQEMGALGPGSRRSNRILGEICRQIDTARYDLAALKRCGLDKDTDFVCQSAYQWAYPPLGIEASTPSVDIDVELGLRGRIALRMQDLALGVVSIIEAIAALVFILACAFFPLLILSFGDDIFLLFSSYWPLWSRLLVLGLAGVLLYYVRCNWRISYGLVEGSVGLALAYRSLTGSPYLVTLLGVIASLYVIVQSLDNIYQGLEEPRKSQWERCFFRARQASRNSSRTAFGFGLASSPERHDEIYSAKT